MGQLRNRLDEVRFHCDECDSRFDARPSRVEDAPDDVWHPWRYFALCRLCEIEAPQEARHRHLLKMWANATGPRTDEGKAVVTGNLKHGPEQTRLTRFNGLKHGLQARTATFWPAKPGEYPHCENCEYRYNICVQAMLTHKACQKRTELFMQHHIAFETGDPKLLTDLNADLHANLRAIINDMLIAIIQDGARQKTPEWYYDKDGGFHLAKGTDRETGQPIQLFTISEHPLIKRIGELITRLGLSLSDMGMTPKVQEEEQAMRGFVTQHGQSTEDAAMFQERQVQALENLTDMIARSRQAVARDPVLLEHSSGSDQQ